MDDDEVSFFFQAEDGIRDRNVTGVQTCALPISRGFPRDFSDCLPRKPPRRSSRGLLRSSRWRKLLRAGWLSREIGRASCRERVSAAGVQGRMEKQTEQVKASASGMG